LILKISLKIYKSRPEEGMRQDFKFLEAPPILNKKIEIPFSKRKTYAGRLCL
jgi:hypothetical protein